MPGMAHQLTWEKIDPAYIEKVVCLARDEDTAGEGLIAPMRPARAGDPTTEVSAPRGKVAAADLVARKPCTLSGLSMLASILKIYGGNG